MKNILSVFYILLLLKILILDNNGVNSENTNVWRPYLRGVMDNGNFKIDTDKEGEMHNVAKGEEEQQGTQENASSVNIKNLIMKRMYINNS
ncbi:S-antigen, putative [Plasmodium berghei]|uniref:S-antigen, putative n=1 Tax=Plasmodium berghei TaxID=5821 RepID=A0A1C6WUM5_PLABE|nr:S-antigen, putative [Plasmodium berghei]